MTEHKDVLCPKCDEQKLYVKFPNFLMEGELLQGITPWNYTCSSCGHRWSEDAKAEDIPEMYKVAYKDYLRRMARVTKP